MKFLAALTVLLSLQAYSQSKFFPGTCTPDQKFCAAFSPDDMPIALVEDYLGRANSSIKIATYNMNVDFYSEILRQKLLRGVKVEFGVDYKLSFDSNSVWRSLKSNSNLKKFRIPVMRGGNPQMHNKIIIIDNKTVITGSANYTFSGLAGNYENVVAVTEPSIVAKYIAEFEELKNLSRITCETMSDTGCGTGEERYPADFDALLKTGSLPGSSLVSTAGACAGLVKGYGLLTAENKFFSPSMGDCFKEAAKYKKLESLLSVNEKKSVSVSSDKYQAYFSPEDNLENVILSELSKTLSAPSSSFAYISVNFITNKKFAAKLVEMKRAGVRMKVFFDRGRFDDSNFKVSLDILKELGFNHGGDDENLITIFDNKLVGPYGCNHNKLAVIGSSSDVTVLNGSANWSAGAMTKNDENLMVIKDKDLAAIYLREIISQLFVYRYGQQKDAAGFKKDIDVLSLKVPCLKSYLGLEKKCAGNMNLRSSAMISVAGVPAKIGSDRVWAWVPQLNNNQGGAIELFTHETFAGKWVTAVPMPLNSTYNFKLFTTSQSVDANKQGLSSARWEYDGMGNDKVLVSPAMAVETIQGSYTWGQR